MNHLLLARYMDVGFDPDVPTEPGAYLVVSGESEFFPREVAVFERCGCLWVRLNNLERQIQAFHYSLDDCAWRRI